MTFLLGMLFGGLTAAILGWLDESVRRANRRRRELARLRRAA